MSRKQYADTVVDQNGTVVPGSTITVYLAGTTTPATIYAASTGGAITGSTVTSGADGSYSFWVDSGDYADTQAFKIVAVLAGYGTFTHDNLWFGPLNFNLPAGSSSTISTGVGSIKMSTANPATNTVWLPVTYRGSTYWIPAFTTNSP